MRMTLPKAIARTDNREEDITRQLKNLKISAPSTPPSIHQEQTSALKRKKSGNLPEEPPKKVTSPESSDLQAAAPTAPQRSFAGTPTLAQSMRQCLMSPDQSDEDHATADDQVDLTIYEGRQWGYRG